MICSVTAMTFSHYFVLEKGRAANMAIALNGYGAATPLAADSCGRKVLEEAIFRRTDSLPTLRLNVATQQISAAASLIPCQPMKSSAAFWRRDYGTA
jgi:hypothetical protein